MKRLLIAATSLLVLAGCASERAGTHVDTPLLAGVETLPHSCSEADIRVDGEGSTDAKGATETLAEL